MVSWGGFVSSGGTLAPNNIFWSSTKRVDLNDRKRKLSSLYKCLASWWFQTQHLITKNLTRAARLYWMHKISKRQLSKTLLISETPSPKWTCIIWKPSYMRWTTGTQVRKSKHFCQSSTRLSSKSGESWFARSWMMTTSHALTHSSQCTHMCMSWRQNTTFKGLVLRLKNLWTKVDWSPYLKTHRRSPTHGNSRLQCSQLPKSLKGQRSKCGKSKLG